MKLKINHKNKWPIIRPVLKPYRWRARERRQTCRRVLCSLIQRRRWSPNKRSTWGPSWSWKTRIRYWPGNSWVCFSRVSSSLWSRGRFSATKTWKECKKRWRSSGFRQRRGRKLCIRRPTEGWIRTSNWRFISFHTHIKIWDGSRQSTSTTLAPTRASRWRVSSWF